MAHSKESKRSRITNRSGKGSFTSLPHAVQDCDAFNSLSCKAVKCLINIFRPYNGKNNGDLSCAYKLMRLRGWKSKNHLDNARKELLEKGMIVLTRQGGRNRCSLYAVTWLQIDECNGKLDRAATRIPLGYWKKGFNPELQSVGNELISVPQMKGQRTPNRDPVREINHISTSHCPK